MSFDHARLCWLFLAIAILTRGAEAEVPKCGKPLKGVLILQDFIRKPLQKGADPALPPGVDEHVLPVTISLRIKVNREGDVVHACVMDEEHSPSPTLRLLNEAARSAVMEWKYPRDFGLTGDLQLAHQYAQGVVSFRFLAPVPNAGRLLLLPKRASDTDGERR
jgi:hypothetical protein